MRIELTLDGAGRVSIPKSVREELNLTPGDKLGCELHDGELTLLPIRKKAGLKKKKGMWVFQGGPTQASIPELIEKMRDERLRSLLK